MDPWLQKLLLVVGSIVFPVAWGVVVNWVFAAWRVSNGRKPGDPMFPDYQI